MQMNCEICISFADCQRHRIVPGLIHGGKYVPENIVMVCRSCHDKIHYILRNTRRTDFVQVIEEVRAQCEPTTKYPNISIHRLELRSKDYK